MKKIFTLTAIMLLAIVILGSCRKERVIVSNNENYWLSQEAGEVVYSDPYCSYIVVETYNGYNIIRTNTNSKPYEGELLYGNFSNLGTRDMYNYSGRYVFTATVTDYWLSYGEAMDALDYYCPLYGKGEEKRIFKESTQIRKK